MVLRRVRARHAIAIRDVAAPQTPCGAATERRCERRVARGALICKNEYAACASSRAHHADAAPAFFTPLRVRRAAAVMSYVRKDSRASGSIRCMAARVSERGRGTRQARWQRSDQHVKGRCAARQVLRDARERCLRRHCRVLRLPPFLDAITPFDILPRLLCFIIYGARASSRRVVTRLRLRVLIMLRAYFERLIIASRHCYAAMPMDMLVAHMPTWFVVLTRC